MLSNRVLLKKAITSADLVAGGKLNPQQADRFIDYIVDESVVLKECRVIRMESDKYNLDSIGVNQRIIRKGTEATEPTQTAGIATGRRQLSVTEVILPFDVSYQFLEDNIEKADIEDHVARLFAQQFSNDVEDLAFNGDTTSADPFISIENGWIKIADSDTGTHKVDHNNSQDFKGVVFPSLLRALPDKWKRNPRNLRLYVPPAAEEAYRDQLAARQTALGDEVLQSGRRSQYQGIDVVPVPMMPAGTYLLTSPMNLVFGIRRDISVEKERRPRARLIAYTITARIDYEIVNPDALAIARDYV